MVTAMIPAGSLPRDWNARAVTMRASVESRPPERPTTAAGQPMCASRFRRPAVCRESISSQRSSRSRGSEGTNGRGSYVRSRSRYRGLSGNETGTGGSSGGVGDSEKNVVWRRRSLCSRRRSMSAWIQAGAEPFGFGHQAAVLVDQVVSGEHHVRRGLPLRPGIRHRGRRTADGRTGFSPGYADRRLWRWSHRWPTGSRSRWRRPVRRCWTAGAAPRDPRRSPRPARSRIWSCT